MHPTAMFSSSKKENKSIPQVIPPSWEPTYPPHPFSFSPGLSKSQVSGPTSASGSSSEIRFNQPSKTSPFFPSRSLALILSLKNCTKFSKEFPWNRSGEEPLTCLKFKLNNLKKNYIWYLSCFLNIPVFFNVSQSRFSSSWFHLKWNGCLSLQSCHGTAKRAETASTCTLERSDKAAARRLSDFVASQLGFPVLFQNGNGQLGRWNKN